MAVNFQIKGMLARLLATEDLIVEHKKVETASFNVHTRVLTLPMWEKASDIVYTMLVAHECAHAIYTDDIDWTQDHKIPPQFVNVVEDARIEKLMKRRYAGLAKTFFNGYKELSEQDFFSLKDDDVNTYNLADKANLYFKIGNFISLDFHPKEREIIDVIASTETFSDVLTAAKLLYDFCKKEQHREELDINIPESQSGGQGNLSSEDSEDNESEEVDNQSDKKSEKPSFSGSNDSMSNMGGENQENPKVKTMESLEDSIRDLVSHDSYENVYIEVPELDLSEIIVPNSEIHSKCETHWNYYSEKMEVFSDADSEYRQFKNSAQKEVNYLVKEFECKKAADSYARATTSHTGVLDCSKLHSYKYSEDIFKKITTLADGKNHGLIFILDWSGSMSKVIMDTLKQLYNLIWFCRKVSIPFEVYAFTTDYPWYKYDDNGNRTIRTCAYKKREGVFYIGEWFSMMNLFTSKVNSATLETQMKNIFRLAYTFEKYASYSVPSGLALSGTPLNESLITLHQILPKFQKENKLQKVQCVILTDGEGSCLKYHREFNRKWENEPYMGTAHIESNAFLRDRKTGNTYSFGGDWNSFTDTLLHNLRDKFVNTNFIGIRVLDSRDASAFIRLYTGYNAVSFYGLYSSWKKDKSFSIKNSGYHTYFGLSSSALSQDAEFEVAECATKAQIKNAFVKSFRSKKMNKRILGEFIELIA